MTDFNMPPGVSVSDIPGNRPEDLAEDEWWDRLGRLNPDLPAAIWDDVGVQKLVESARDLAWAAGYREGRFEAELAEAARQSESVNPQPQDRGEARALAVAIRRYLPEPRKCAGVPHRKLDQLVALAEAE